jgi:short-subunit dehydrogenase
VPGTALVTGASSGIGEQFARQLAARGHDLVLVARRADRLEAVAAELPTEARVIACDLGADAASLPARVAELGLEVELLVNNAGFGTHGRFWELPEGRDAELVRVNCEAVVVLTRAFLPRMVERRAGGVIVVASTAGMQPLPYEAVYAASKAFAFNFAGALNAELRGSGVRCLAVTPGPVPTEWQRVAGWDEMTRMPGTIGAEQVVRESLAAYDRGAGSIVPGALFRWAMRASALGPRALKLRVTERLYRPSGSLPEG